MFENSNQWQSENSVHQSFETSFYVKATLWSIAFMVVQSNLLEDIEHFTTAGADLGGSTVARQKCSHCDLDVS
jgi:hypothetical protein